MIQIAFLSSCISSLRVHLSNCKLLCYWTCALCLLFFPYENSHNLNFQCFQWHYG
uniref:Uncharacterized protein n=1 Tax=Rhizophora mucronata TaxID=61149 RepID=A0A2P2PRK7_RHIMU